MLTKSLGLREAEMSWTKRFINLFRQRRLNQELDEEMASHIEEAIEHGRDPEEVRRAFGSMLLHRDQSRDARVIGWLDSLRADAILGWRQLGKSKATSVVAILSLGLAFGACTSAFRLIDALLLRPLPIKNPERLYVFRYKGIGYDGSLMTIEASEYPMFRRMLPVLKGQADLLAISYAHPRDLTYASDEDMERPYLQYVSGWMFNSFGIRPALGRLFTRDDDLKPGAHPYAVLSYDYWTRRFGRDPRVIGHSLRLVNLGGMPLSSNDLYTIIGVAGKGFTGVEPGSITDVFLPTMMHPLVDEPNASWFRTFVILKPGVTVESVREKLHAVFRAFREERAKVLGMPRQTAANFLNQRILLEPATGGFSALQGELRKPLAALAVMVALVLLVACVNVANLMTSQAAARAREMALRVSIGAGRARLVQLVLVQAAILALFAAATGAALASWSAPFVAGHINFRNDPVRLRLPADWRVASFGLALTLAVTLLFGLAPALRASAVNPASALKGVDQPYFRSPLIQVLVAAQASFCFLVLFAGVLFVTTFERLSRQPTGFSPEHLLALDVLLRRPEPPEIWNQVVEHLRTVPGVAGVGLGQWAPLSGFSSERHISIPGGPPSPDPVFLLDVAPGWFGAMKIPLIAGRDFTFSDTDPKFAIINEAFAKRYCPGKNPVGKVFGSGDDSFQIIGVIRNARYNDMHGPVPPVAYFPFREIDAKGVVQSSRSATLMVRTRSADPLALASTLRKEVARARPGFRVSNVRTEDELIESQTVRERLLAALALFFALLALLLAGLGLYGVLHYSVLQRQREIAIRMAVGAPSTDIAHRVMLDVSVSVLVGSLAGLALSLTSARYIESLLYDVKPNDAVVLALPWLIMTAAVLLSALPSVIRAMRIDPAQTLRVE